MDSASKFDLIDLIINVLQDHEASLDELVKKLEKINVDFEESLNDLSYFNTGENDITKDKLRLKIKSLEEKLEKYKNALNSVLQHCEKINDVVCLRIMAEETIK